jgi:hypothetical protein
MKSIILKLKGVLSKNVSIVDYRKYLSKKYSKRASKTKFQKAMAKVAKVPPPSYGYDRL